ncbi:MAG: hypothetical protein M1834_002650 [Cirrosporium novae-zelandiae]|nr:MAG: hypothetical protein M1834_002650 [Cirrosporium novae-zelandiae]
MASSNNSETFSLPILSLPALSTPDGASALLSAIRSSGAFYLTEHGLASSLTERAFFTAKNLFSLPHDIKNLAPHPPGAAVHRGYSGIGLEKVYDQNEVRRLEAEGKEKEVEDLLRKVQDYKESYEIGSEENSDQPNQWIPEDKFPRFKEFTMEFYWACQRLSMEVLEAFALALSLGEKSKKQFLTTHSSGHGNQLRLLHYPAISQSQLDTGTQERMPGHCDWSTFTMLLQDSAGGLEVDVGEGNWIPVEPIPDAIVVNLGDAFVRWTGDFVRSPKHRVVVPQGAARGEERYSIPYFIGPPNHGMIECFSEFGGDPKYKPISFLDFAMEKAKYSYQDKEEEENN